MPGEQRGPAGWAGEPFLRLRNLQANPQVTVELGDETHHGVARVLEAGAADDQLARQSLLTKYADSEDNLDEWGRTSLPVVIEFQADTD
jgi:F420H(2)-dependent quinone reductase